MEDLATLSQRCIYIKLQETQFNLRLYLSEGRALGRRKVCVCVSFVSVYLSICLWDELFVSLCVRICMSVSLSIWAHCFIEFLAWGVTYPALVQVCLLVCLFCHQMAYRHHLTSLTVCREVAGVFVMDGCWLPGSLLWKVAEQVNYPSIIAQCVTIFIIWYFKFKCKQFIVSHLLKFIFL